MVGLSLHLKSRPRRLVERSRFAAATPPQFESSARHRAATSRTSTTRTSTTCRRLRDPFRSLLTTIRSGPSSAGSAPPSTAHAAKARVLPICDINPAQVNTATTPLLAVAITVCRRPCRLGGMLNFYRRKAG